jgi:hypothetical protein
VLSVEPAAVVIDHTAAADVVHVLAEVVDGPVVGALNPGTAPAA